MFYFCLLALNLVEPKNSRFVEFIARKLGSSNCCFVCPSLVKQQTLVVAKATLDTSAVSDTVRVSWKIVGFLKAKHPPAATHITAVGKEAVVLAKEERAGGLGLREEKDRRLPVAAVRVAHPRVAAVEVHLEVDHHREEEVHLEAATGLPREAATAHRREVATGLPREVAMAHRREVATDLPLEAMAAMVTTMVEETTETTTMAVMGTTMVTEGTETTTMEEMATTMMEATMAATMMEPRTMMK